MSIDKKAALEQIDAALQRYEAWHKTAKRGIGDIYEPENKVRYAEIVSCLRTTLIRVAGPDSTYGSKGDADVLAGVLKTLRNDIEAGFLTTYVELIHGETFSDFLEMASHLLNEKYHIAAATIAGGVLEQHLRALCTKHGVSPVPGNMNNLNNALYRQPPGVYPSQWMKQITAWADIRNNAAHGHYDKVNPGLVEPMIAGIRLFIVSHPA